MSDPLEQLRAPIEPVSPPDTFARALRRRMLDALGVDPEDISRPIDQLDVRRTTMPTTSTPTASTSATTAEAAANPGIRAVTPYLTVHDAAAAIDFYVAAFGGVEEFRVVSDDGRIGHAELRIGDVRLQLSDEHAEIDVVSPRTLGGSGLAISLTVVDCDALWERALAAGAAGERAPEDQPHGNRMAVLRDPFGHRWFLLQPTETFDVDSYAARIEGTGFQVQAPAAVGPLGGRTSLDGIWPAVHYTDAGAAIRFAVQVLGFEELIVVTDPSDPDVVVHSELRWPEGGIVQIASSGRPDSIYARQPGGGVLYVITLDPESVLARCIDAGADIVDPMQEVDYGVAGDRNFTVRDAEQNLWCFGTYGARR